MQTNFLKPRSLEISVVRTQILGQILKNLKSIPVLIIFLLSSCNFPNFGLSIPEIIDITSTPPVNTNSPAQDYEPVECAFMWAYDPLPELSSDFNEALKDVQPEAEGYAQAYGENCVTDKGEVIRFLAMETDFYVTLEVDDLGDQKVLGTLVERVMEVLTEFPTEDTPGIDSGYIEVIFETPEDELRFWVKRTEVEAALEDGLGGEELFTTLQSK